MEPGWGVKWRQLISSGGLICEVIMGTNRRGKVKGRWNRMGEGNNV